MKRLVVFLLFLFLAAASPGRASDPFIISGTGTINFIGVEGGFYGIIADDGEKYDPLNLGEEFQVDGLEVYFDVRIKKGIRTFHMWGIPVEIQKIKKKTRK